MNNVTTVLLLSIIPLNCPQKRNSWYNHLMVETRSNSVETRSNSSDDGFIHKSGYISVTGLDIKLKFSGSSWNHSAIINTKYEPKICSGWVIMTEKPFFWQIMNNFPTIAFYWLIFGIDYRWMISGRPWKFQLYI